jgi:hypothetical protein
MIKYNKSSYALEGDTIQWTSSAGVLNGVVTRIDREKRTADPKVTCDYYLINMGNVNGFPNTAFLNSNAMQQLKVTNLTQLRNEKDENFVKKSEYTAKEFARDYQSRAK